MREVNVMARLNHNNIVRYYDSWFDDWAPELSQIHMPPSIPTVGSSANTCSFGAVQSAASGKSVSVSTCGRGRSPYTAAYSSSSPNNVTYLYIRMELCQSHTLKDWLDKHREHRALDQCVAIVKDVVTAVDYLHQQNCMHRDIKVLDLCHSVQPLTLGWTDLLPDSLRSKVFGTQRVAVFRPIVVQPAIKSIHRRS